MMQRQPMTGDHNALIAELRKLGPGQKLIYCEGYLGMSPSSTVAVASEALKLSNEGKVHLTQRRLGPPVFKGEVNWSMGVGPGFEYIATGALRAA